MDNNNQDSSKSTKYLNLAIEAALLAGEAIMKIYDKKYKIKEKSDNSPLTEADLAADQIICEKLKSTKIPIISEETNLLPYQIRKEWQQAWIVDPLDGTKEFINKNGEFTVNIALIDNGQPILGIVYAPALQQLYYGAKGLGSYEVKIAKNGNVADLLTKSKKIFSDKSTDKIVIVASRSHNNADTDEFIKNISTKTENVEIQNAGSSLKFCLLASGKAHIYPRFGRTMEWDVAAGHAVLVYSGGTCEQLDNQPIKYNKENLENPFFIGLASSILGMKKQLM